MNTYFPSGAPSASAWRADTLRPVNATLSKPDAFVCTLATTKVKGDIALLDATLRQFIGTTGYPLGSSLGNFGCTWFAPPTGAGHTAVRAVDAAVLAFLACGGKSYDYDMKLAIDMMLGLWASRGGAKLPGGKCNYGDTILFIGGF